MSNKIRWGILSTADISHKVAKAIQKTSNNVIICIASRSISKAKEFAEKYSIPKTYGSYQEIIDDPEVDVVYIPLPTTMHLEWTLKAAKMKKHVLCDKPLAVNADDAKLMIEACKNNGVQLMDGVHFVHHLRAKSMFTKIKDEAILGKLKSFTSAFTLDLHDKSNIRYDKNLEPLGCLGDLGWYNVRALMLAYNYEKPQKIYASAVFENDVPIRLNAMLWFSENKTATIECAFDCKLRQWFEVTGTKAALWCWDFCLPYNTLELDDKFSLKASYEIKVADHNLHFFTNENKQIFTEESLQEMNMIVEMENIVRSKKLTERWFNETLLNQQIVDAIIKSAKSNTPVFFSDN